MQPLKYTERLRRVMGLALTEARRLNSEFIEEAHLLLGILAEGDGVAARALREMNVDVTRLKEELERRAPFLPGAPATSGQLPFSPASKWAIEMAVEAAAGGVVGTEHLLLGLMRLEGGVAAGVLDELGATLPLARDLVLRLQAAGATQSPVHEQRTTSVIGHARDEARRLRCEHIGPDQLLLGILREGGAGARVLANLAVDVERLRREVEQRVTPSTSAVAIVAQLPFSPSARRVLEEAGKAAEAMGHPRVHSGHLLLGLAMAGEGGLGLSVDAVRTAVSRLGFVDH